MSNDTMHIPISERIAGEFLSSLEDSLGSVDDMALEDFYLSSSVRDGVPISYSQSLEPFIGQTRGYNPPEDRVYLDEDTFVLRTIREALIDAGERENGARVFLTSSGAYYVANDEEITLVTWDWPAKNLEEEVVALGKNT